MTTDEYDAKCWRAMKTAINEALPKMSAREKVAASDIQYLMTCVEVEVNKRVTKSLEPESTGVR